MSETKIEYSYFYNSFTKEHRDDSLSIGYAFTKEKFHLTERVKSNATMRTEYNADWEISIDLELKQLKPRNFKKTHLNGYISNNITHFRQIFDPYYFQSIELSYIEYVRDFYHPWMTRKKNGTSYSCISRNFQTWLLEIGLSFNIKTHFYDDHEAYDIDFRRGYIAKPREDKED